MSLKPLFSSPFPTEADAIRAIERECAAMTEVGFDLTTVAAVLDLTPRANGVTAVVAPRAYLLRNGTPSNFPHFDDGDLLVVAVNARRQFADIPLKQLVAELDKHEAKQ